MRKIPAALKKKIASNPTMKSCAYKTYPERGSAHCSGRITWEHAFIYAGRQINEEWAIIPLCWFHHLGAGLNKRFNEYLALRRATEEDLKKYPNRDWKQLKDDLADVR